MALNNKNNDNNKDIIKKISKKIIDTLIKAKNVFSEGDNINKEKNNIKEENNIVNEDKDIAKEEKDLVNAEKEKVTNGATGYLGELDFINQGFKNDCQRLARNMSCVKKYGTGYISFMRPQYEGDEKDNGNETIYFDNKEMLFMKRKPKRGGKKKEDTNEEQT